MLSFGDEDFEDEDDIISFDEKGEHTAWNLFLYVARQSESFFEDETRRDSLQWARSPVEQTHFRAGHRGRSRPRPLLRRTIVLAGHFRPSSPKAQFRRTPSDGKPHFTMMSLHSQNTFAKKRSVAVKTSSWQLVPSCGKKQLTSLLGISTVQVGDASRDRNNSSTVQLRRRSTTPSSQCHPLWEEFQMSRLMNAASSNSVRVVDT